MKVRDDVQIRTKGIKVRDTSEPDQISQRDGQGRVGSGLWSQGSTREAGYRLPSRTKR